MYIMNLIYKTGFINLDFLILSKSTISKISKTIIFVDKINNAIEIEKYLQSKVLKQIWNKKDLKDIIYIFLTNFTITSKSKFLANF